MILFRKIKQVFLISIFTCLVSLVMFSNKISASEYYDPTMDNLTHMLFSLDVIDIKDKEVFKDFMKANFCSVYKEFVNNQFDWNEIHKAFLMRKGEFQEDKRLQYKILSDFIVTGYDFNTRSFELSEESVLKDVAALRMNNPNYSLCEKSKNMSTKFKSLPQNVVLNLELPLSLYRIPISSNAAEVILPKLEQLRAGDYMVYAEFYVHVETAKAVSNEATKYMRKAVDINAYGYIEKIVFYIDESRRLPIKTIYYDY